MVESSFYEAWDVGGIEFLNLFFKANRLDFRENVRLFA